MNDFALVEPNDPTGMERKQTVVKNDFSKLNNGIHYRHRNIPIIAGIHDVMCHLRGSSSLHDIESTVSNQTCNGIMLNVSFNFICDKTF